VARRRQHLVRKRGDVDPCLILVHAFSHIQSDSRPIGVN
jgi:hypothetical protein